jgi:uncharacterized protein with PIN domain
MIIINIFFLNFHSVREIKFVTDSMIGSLGRVLRQVGIDTIILKGEFVDHDECVRYSQNENRIILTASKSLWIRVIINA